MDDLGGLSTDLQFIWVKGNDDADTTHAIGTRYADGFAKGGAALHELPEELLEVGAKLREKQIKVARWLGKAAAMQDVPDRTPKTEWPQRTSDERRALSVARAGGLGLGRWLMGASTRELPTDRAPWQAVARAKVAKRKADEKAEREEVRRVVSNLCNICACVEQPVVAINACVISACKELPVQRRATTLDDLEAFNFDEMVDDDFSVNHVANTLVETAPPVRRPLRRALGEDDLELTLPRRGRLKSKTPSALTFYSQVVTKAPEERKRAARVAPETVSRQDAEGHLLFTVDGLLWCWRCGRYAMHRTHGLGIACTGKPGKGQEYRLKRLKEGKHLVTNRPFTGRAKRLLA